MSVMKKFPWVLASLSACVVSVSAHADGLSDLKSALSRLQGQTPLKAVVDAKTWNRQGEGKDLEESQGNASVTVEENQRGLQVLYSKDMLAKLENEEQQKEKDQKAKTPTLAALGEVNSSALRPIISASGYLLRNLEKANFKSEKQDQYNGKPARVLNFELSIDQLTEKDRKYIKKYTGNFDIWIAQDGTPLFSRRAQKIEARAFLVVSFESKNEEEWVYGTVGDRLVALRREAKNSGAGMGERTENKSIKTLHVQSM